MNKAVEFQNCVNHCKPKSVRMVGTGVNALLTFISLCNMDIINMQCTDCYYLLSHKVKSVGTRESIQLYFLPYYCLTTY